MFTETVTVKLRQISAKAQEVQILTGGECNSQDYLPRTTCIETELRVHVEKCIICTSRVVLQINIVNLCSDTHNLRENYPALFLKFPKKIQQYNVLHSHHAILSHKIYISLNELLYSCFAEIGNL